MKKRITKFLSRAFLAFAASLALLAPAAHAVTYNDGDLFLGFYSSTSSKDYLLYIGNYTNYTTNGGAFNGSSFSIGTASAINADLTNAFGAGWFSDPNVKWGVIGIQDYFGTNTVFLTDPHATATTSAWSALASGDQQAVGGAVNGLAQAFLSGGAGGATAAGGKIQSTATLQSYYDYSPLGTQSLGASFLYYGNGGIDTSSRSAYLAELVATDNGGAGLLADGSKVIDGQFTVASNGAISYAAVPEPSTYAMIGVGAGLLFMAARRKTCKA